MSSAAPTVVVIPVKAFGRAKLRLASALGAAGRATLARRMAEVVVGAAAPLPVAVVCDDDEVRDWALAQGAEVCWTPQLGLNGAVTSAVDELATRGVDRVIVAHADLPFARDLPAVAGSVPADGIGLVPDRHEDGTNVVVLPTGTGFTFAYGPGSFQRHLDEALRAGLEPTILRPRHLGWDVDEPGDLDLPAWAPEGALSIAGLDTGSALP